MNVYVNTYDDQMKNMYKYIVFFVLGGKQYEHRNWNLYCMSGVYTRIPSSGAFVF